MKQRATTQKNTLLKNAQENAKSIFFKRVFFLQPKKNLKIFSPTLQKKLHHPNAQC